MSALRPVPATLAALCALAFAPGALAKGPSPMVDKINAVRSAHGVPAASYSPSLSRSSHRFVSFLARTHQFTHAARIRASPRFSKLGEILAFTREWNVRREGTMDRWLASPSHRAVLLDPSFRYVGAARVRGYLDGRPVVFWAAQFGR